MYATPSILSRTNAHFPGPTFSALTMRRDMGVKGSYLPCINLTSHSAMIGPGMEYMPVSCHETPAFCRCVLSTKGDLTSHHHRFRSHCLLRTKLRIYVHVWRAYLMCVCLLRRMIMSVAELGRAQELLNSCICTRQVAGDQLVINPSL
jgi:hypothetical protein